MVFTFVMHLLKGGPRSTDAVRSGWLTRRARWPTMLNTNTTILLLILLSSTKFRKTRLAGHCSCGCNRGMWDQPPTRGSMGFPATLASAG